MTLTSLAKFAASHGVSKQAATKWKSAGVIVFHDGQVDVAASDERMRRAGLGRFKEASTAPRQPSTGKASTAAPMPTPPRRPAKPPKPAPADAWEVVGDVRAARAAAHAAQDPSPKAPEPADLAFAGDVGEIVASIMAGGIRHKVEAEELKENALAAKHLVALQRETAQLVPLEDAERTLFEAARQFRDMLLNWPTRIGPYLAADLGLSPEVVGEALERHVHELLAMLGEPEAKFSEGA